MQDFDLKAYLGKWYEIARTDNRFERGMEQVTAEYSLREDGGIGVLNRGYLPETKEWKQIEAKMPDVDDPVFGKRDPNRFRVLVRYLADKEEEGKAS